MKRWLGPRTRDHCAAFRSASKIPSNSAERCARRARWDAATRRHPPKMPRWWPACAGPGRSRSRAPICPTCCLHSRATTCCSAPPATPTTRRAPPAAAAAARRRRATVAVRQLAWASDAGGSVRWRTAFCGIAGLKPTSGRLPRTGHFPPAGGWIEALWQIGPMARHVEDLCTVMPLLVGGDGRDRSVVDMPFHEPARVELGGLRVAFHTDNGLARADAEVAGVVGAAARALAGEMAALEEDRPGCLEQAYGLEMKLLGADGGDGLREYLQALGSTQVHPLLTGWLDKLEAYRTSVAGFAAYWAEWDAYRAAMGAFLRRYDVMLCPVYTHAALPHGASTEDENFHGFSHTMAYNVSGWPAAVVRCGASATGLPIGVQIVAAPWREDIALAVAARLEREFGGWKAPVTQ